MAIFKCKMCGGDLNITAGMTVVECEYCGTKQTVPSVDSEKKMTLFNRANRLRLACEFDKAAGIYESIVAEFPNEAEAYWGLVLCKYGIEYVDDPATGKKIPTCHRSSFDSVMDDSDLEQAQENADVIARKLYREEAKQIEQIRKGIIEVSGKEAPYDIFICYKETDENGDRTLDSVLAQDVYDALTEKGYRVFFSRISLEEKLGVEYEPYIFAALHSAKIMLAFGTDYEYYNAVWVKNEWSRFLQLMAQDKSKHLIPCFRGLDAYDMPKEFAKLQAQDLGKVGAIQDLLRGIEKLLPRQEKAQSAAHGDSLAPLLDRVQIFLEDGDWEKAAEYCEKVLDQDARNAMAYLLKACAKLKVPTVEALEDREHSQYGELPEFKRAVQFADAGLGAKLARIEAGGKALTQKRLEAEAAAKAEAERKRLEAEEAERRRKEAQEAERKRLEAEEAERKRQAAEAERRRKEAEAAERKRLQEEEARRKRGEELCAKDCKIVDGVLKMYTGKEAQLYIPRGVTVIGGSALCWKSDVTDIIIPDGVTHIGETAFMGCSKLKSVTIPNSVTWIGKWAFSSCSSLTSIQIPRKVTEIGENILRGCSELETITVAPGNPVYHSAGNCLIRTATKELIAGCKNSVIPEDGSVVKICSGAFGSCAPADIRIPSCVTNVPQDAFPERKGIQTITVGPGNPFYHSASNCLIATKSKVLIIGCNNSVIPNDGSVTSIGSHAFEKCTALNAITIPYGIQVIQNCAFEGCTALTQITLPDSVTAMGYGAFRECTALTGIQIPSRVTEISLQLFMRCVLLTDIQLPKSLTGIETAAFMGCTSLTEIVIPDNVTKIDSGAFEGCTSLSRVVLPNRATKLFDKKEPLTLGLEAFSKCTSLKTVSVPKGCKGVKDAFDKTCKVSYNKG